MTQHDRARATYLRPLALVLAADWLAGDPAAVDRARALAEHAADTGETGELIAALLDALGVALGTTQNVRKARQRLEERAVMAADVLLDAAADAGRYRHREGR